MENSEALMNSQKPRGRIFQSDEFEISYLKHCRIESFLSVACSSDQNPYLFMLKPVDSYWQIIFFDSGIAFWEEWGNEEIEDILGEATCVNIFETYNLTDQMIENITCLRGPKVQVVTESGVFSLEPIESLELDCTTRVTYSKCDNSMQPPSRPSGA